MMQVKFFLNRELDKLAKDINCWLREHYDDIQVTDIKYQFIGDKYLSAIGDKYLSALAFSTMVIYEKKE